MSLYKQILNLHPEYTSVSGPTLSDDRMRYSWYNNKTGKKGSISVARAKLEIKFNRILTSDEEADHIDDNKSNDHIDNLQILSREQNTRKMLNIRIEKARIKGICTYCGIGFNLKEAQRQRYRKGQKDFYCNKSCAISGRYNK